MYGGTVSGQHFAFLSGSWTWARFNNRSQDHVEELWQEYVEREQLKDLERQILFVDEIEEVLLEDIAGQYRVKIWSENRAATPTGKRADCDFVDVSTSDAPYKRPD